MDEILAKASNQAMSFAIRSGISIASGFAIKTLTRFLDKIPKSQKAEIEAARLKLKAKVDIVSSSIDLIKLEAARGNSALLSALHLVNELEKDIESFDERVQGALEIVNTSNEKDTIRKVEAIFKSLIESINEAIPLINLSLVTCGVHFSNTLSAKISPSRLLQSSAILVESNKSSENKDPNSLSVGPVFDLKLFTVFYNPSRLKYAEDGKQQSSISDQNSVSLALAISWKEEFARALCKLRKLSHLTFEYELKIDEDFDDGRYHEEDEKPRSRTLRITDIDKQFFSVSGRLLRLEGSNSPILILKTRTSTGYEYIAFGETGRDFEDSSDEESINSSEQEEASQSDIVEKTKTLSLLECLLRLASLQEIEQKSLLEINDEKLAFYLSNQADSSPNPKSSFGDAKNEKFERDETLLLLDSNTTRLAHLSLGRNLEAEFGQGT